MGIWLQSVTGVLLAAQAVSVPVTGTVRDAESGLPLPEAIVLIGSSGRSARTGEDGRYALDAAPGSQRVSVQRLGYAAQTFDALVPSRGSLEINVALRREPIIFPPIEVQAAVPIRGLEGGLGLDFPDRSLSHSAMYNHPLLPEPDAFAALDGGEVSVDPESPSGIHIRGGASDQVAYLLDGIPVFSPYHTAGTFSALNPDALSSIDLVTTAPLPSAPDALSGVVTANTRTPGSRLHSRGSVSATQARAVVDGPLGNGGAGYLASVGSAFPGLIRHKSESSHLFGENFDWLGKVESPLWGGRIRLVGYGSQTEVEAATFPQADTSSITPPRNQLNWDSRSLGGEWSRPVGGATFVLRSWSAVANADAGWIGPDSLENLTSVRRDDGIVAMIDARMLGGSTTTGVRAQRSETSYALRPVSGAGRSLAFGVDHPISTVFVEHRRPITSRADLDVAVSNAWVDGASYASPSAQLRWRAARSLTFTAGAARRHQFAQSLRNSESPASNIFPADLYVGAGAGGVPVAGSNLAVVGIEHRPAPWLRVGAQVFAREFDSLALVAPLSADPFATQGFVTGSGDARGFSLEAGASGIRYGVFASYAYQRVSLEYADGRYVPDYGAAHSLEAGVVLFPAPTYSVRLGLEGALGRHATATRGPFEWEACNLVDEGCEFAGSPTAWSEPLGATRLPAYFRLDLGVRKQWPMTVGGREGRVAVFGTATNLLARKNVLTFSVDPETGARTPVEMRPLSPLVVGLDWSF